MALFDAYDPAVPAPVTAPLALEFDATETGPVPIGEVALPLAVPLPLAL